VEVEEMRTLVKMLEEKILQRRRLEEGKAQNQTAKYLKRGEVPKMLLQQRILHVQQ
jgi:hypothetical protein